MPWPRIFALIAAVLCLGGAPMRALGAIAGDVIAHCCCGPHDADDDCGCPHCPASPDHDDGGESDEPTRPADGVPRAGPCGLQGELGTLIVVDLALVAPVVVHAETPPRYVAFAAPPRLAIGLATRPAEPPPRG